MGAFSTLSGQLTKNTKKTDMSGTQFQKTGKRKKQSLENFRKFQKAPTQRAHLNFTGFSMEFSDFHLHALEIY